MATTDQIWARIPQATDISVKNTSASVAIAQGDLVTCDPAFPLTVTSQIPGVIQSSVDDDADGVALEAIPVGGIGKIATAGFVQVVASAAITAGAMIQSAGSGKVKTSLAAKPQVGKAWTAAAGNNDLVWMHFKSAHNA